MTKKDLAKIYVKNKYAPSVSDATQQIDNFIDVIKKGLQSGNDISISGFLSMEIVEKPAQNFKDLHTGERKILPAKKRLKIKQMPSFKKWAEGNQL